MKKISLIVVMLAIVGLHQLAQAQMGVAVSGGTGLSSIPERFGNSHVSFLSSYSLTSSLDVGVSIGFQHFVPERTSNQYTNVIPLTLEGRYKLESEGVRPYAQLELGVAQVDRRYKEHTLYPIDFYEFMPDANYSRRHKQWYPMISMGLGAFIPLSNQFSLDFGLRLGMITGGGATHQTLIYGRVPQTISGIQQNADSWNYLRLVIGIRADL